MEEKIYEGLEKEAKYALDSHSRNLVYQTYGKAQMAYKLKAITRQEYRKLDSMLVRYGLNDPAHCRLE